MKPHTITLAANGRNVRLQHDTLSSYPRIVAHDHEGGWIGELRDDEWGSGEIADFAREVVKTTGENIATNLRVILQTIDILRR